jgi:plasmid stabilization system protein ParE
MVGRAGQRPQRTMPTPYDVALTPGALADVDRLDQFVREKNPAAADRMLEALNAGFTRLSTMPHVGRPVPTSTLRALIVRFGQGSYVCLYEVQDKQVILARVFHGREDWR